VEDIAPPFPPLRFYALPSAITWLDLTVISESRSPFYYFPTPPLLSLFLCVCLLCFRSPVKGLFCSSFSLCSTRHYINSCLVYTQKLPATPSLFIFFFEDVLGVGCPPLCCRRALFKSSAYQEKELSCRRFCFDIPPPSTFLSSPSPRQDVPPLSLEL